MECGIRSDRVARGVLKYTLDEVETKILPMSPGADVSRGGWIVNFNPNRGTNKRQAVRSSQHTKDR